MVQLAESAYNNNARNPRATTQGDNVADAKTDLNPKEKQWINQALGVLRATLIRKRGTEQPGSAIHELRGKEIQEIDSLIHRLT